MIKLYIVGAGIGDAKLLTGRAIDIIKNADSVVTTDRLAEQYTSVRNDILGVPYGELKNTVAKAIEKCKSVCVLVSGDVGFFSATAPLIKEFEHVAEISLEVGVSSFQYLFSKLGLRYDKAKLVSLHGLTSEFIGAVSYNEYTFMLTGGKIKARNVCEMLANAGLADVNITIGELLSTPNECITQGKASELANKDYNEISVVLAHNENFKSPYGALLDSDFIRAEKVPMTKEEVRWITCARLNINPNDVIVDIGAGSGSVSVEMARQAHNGKVYAIECDKKAYDVLVQNRIKHGAYNIDVMFDRAENALDNLPKPPTKAFLGGTRGGMSEIFDKLHALNNEMHIVINTVTLESLAEATAIMNERCEDVDISCINVSKSAKLGSYNMMKAANPIYILSGRLSK